MNLAALGAAAEAAGLAQRGAFALEPDECVARLAGARVIVLLGMVGAAHWPAFAGSPEARDGAPDPLDRWSRRVVGELARSFGAEPLFPFDGPPYWPFQKWARRAESVAPSPLGALIHPRYGLWHSYRGALAFGQEVVLPKVKPAAIPCETCVRPCLSACPVSAFSAKGFDVEACAGWLRRPEGEDCRMRGCRARRACPVGPDFAQRPEQAHFHMRAFLAARQ